MSFSRRNRFTMILVVIGVMASPCIVFGETKYLRESLKGMSGVLVSVSVDDKSLENHGITESILKTDVEVKLRVARIKVFDDPNDPDWNRTGRPQLIINVQATKFDSAAIYFIRVIVAQDAVLYRGKKPIRAGTWDLAGDTHGGVDSAHTGIRKTLGDIVDIFINDYLAVNPK